MAAAFHPHSAVYNQHAIDPILAQNNQHSQSPIVSSSAPLVHPSPDHPPYSSSYRHILDTPSRSVSFPKEEPISPDSDSSIQDVAAHVHHLTHHQHTSYLHQYDDYSRQQQQESRGYPPSQYEHQSTAHDHDHLPSDDPQPPAFIIYDSTKDDIPRDSSPSDVVLHSAYARRQPTFYDPEAEREDLGPSGDYVRKSFPTLKRKSISV